MHSLRSQLDRNSTHMPMQGRVPWRPGIVHIISPMFVHRGAATGFQKTKLEVTRVVNVGVSTLSARLREFGATETGELTNAQLKVPHSCQPWFKSHAYAVQHPYKFQIMITGSGLPPGTAFHTEYKTSSARLIIWMCR